MTITGASNPPEIKPQTWWRQPSWRLLCVAGLSGLLTIANLSFDSSLSASVMGWHVPGDLRKAINLSEVFAHGFGAAAILGTLLYLAPQRRTVLYLAVLLTLLSGLTANGLKGIVVRVRPHSQESIRVSGTATAQPAEESSLEVVEASFWDARQRSFPSGHAATAWGLAIGLTLAYPRGGWLFASFATLACFQRLSSGAHFPSDVLAGACIAFLWAAILLWVPQFASLLRPPP